MFKGLVKHPGHLYKLKLRQNNKLSNLFVYTSIKMKVYHSNEGLKPRSPEKSP